MKLVVVMSIHPEGLKNTKVTVFDQPQEDVEERLRDRDWRGCCGYFTRPGSETVIVVKEATLNSQY